MTSLHDAYELGGVAGHGRVTVVRLGVRRGDASPVALKQLRIEHTQDPDKRSRFTQQARRACMLQHDGIEVTHDVVDGRDGPVVVSEWIDGRSLERLAISRRRHERAWSPQEVALVARSLLEPLRYAHQQPTGFDAQGMLHGGLWPGNVMVDTEGNIKLVDFGRASVWQEAREPWQDLESLRYLSVDHVRHGATAASDLFAVGAIVHELLAGTRFRAEYQTEAEMRAAIERSDPPPRPREDVPAPLERLRRRLLEPVQNTRLMVEQVLDLCVTIPLGDARLALRAAVTATLRDDSSSQDPDTPPRGISLGAAPESPPDGIAEVRSRVSAAVHVAAGNGNGPGVALEQVPLGQSPRPSRRRETQSVPVPVHHEQTAARTPMFLQQTTRPTGEEVRNAERERSGGAPDGAEDLDEAAIPASDMNNDDTAPLSLGALAGVPQVIENVPKAIVEVEPVLDLGVTAEVERAPRLPEDRYDDDPPPTPAPSPSAALRWLRGPVGWALLGALAVGLGAPLVARCSADEPSPAPAPAASPAPAPSSP